MESVNCVLTNPLNKFSAAFNHKYGVTIASRIRTSCANPRMGIHIVIILTWTSG